MDAERFDRITRALATTPSRRRLLRATTGGVLGAVLGRLRPSDTAAQETQGACRVPGRTCSRNGQCCFNRCQGGTCRCPDGRRACPFNICCGADFVCVGTTCVHHCESGRKEFDETDVDCGGFNDCPRCGIDQRCLVNEDCANGACVGSRCAECVADRDCVAPFRFCVGNACRQCRTDAHCPPARVCLNNVCERHCANGTRDGDETDIDCGGSCPAKCGLDQRCRVNADCRSEFCVGGRCRDHCANGVRDGDESDIDCGGSCRGCDDGQRCRNGADCARGECIGNVCVEDRCDNGRRDGDETDVDCGGPSCPRKCAQGKRCPRDSDCQSRLCENRICQSAGTSCDGLVGFPTGVSCREGTFCACVQFSATEADCICCPPCGPGHLASNCGGSCCCRTCDDPFGAQPVCT